MNKKRNGQHYLTKITKGGQEAIQRGWGGGGGDVSRYLSITQETS